jgi:hypothetical protein
MMANIPYCFCAENFEFSDGNCIPITTTTNQPTTTQPTTTQPTTTQPTTTQLVVCTNGQVKNASGFCIPCYGTKEMPLSSDVCKCAENASIMSNYPLCSCDEGFIENNGACLLHSTTKQTTTTDTTTTTQS